MKFFLWHRAIQAGVRDVDLGLRQSFRGCFKCGNEVALSVHCLLSWVSRVAVIIRYRKDVVSSLKRADKNFAFLDVIQVNCDRTKVCTEFKVVEVLVVVISNGLSILLRRSVFNQQGRIGVMFRVIGAKEVKQCFIAKAVSAIHNFVFIGTNC